MARTVKSPPMGTANRRRTAPPGQVLAVLGKSKRRDNRTPSPTPSPRGLTPSTTSPAPAVSPANGAAPRKRKTAGKASIKVAVRCRPLNKGELGLGDQEVLGIMQDSVVTLKDPKFANASDKGDPLARSRETQYAFDFAFWHDVDTKRVYERTVAPVIDSVLAGRPGTVFAYGATGSGKTYTMSGTRDNPGLMFHTINSLFERLEASENTFKVTASYLEIYNEALRDLLSAGVNLELREDRLKGISVAGITEYRMNSVADTFRILQRGSANRSVDSHALNQESSRSHAVFWVVVEQFSEDKLTPIRSANLTMIDLAGSERAKKSGTNKKMLREGAKINRSLLALANCINALGQNKKGLHIPYRDSKLTRLLKDSLSGGSGGQTVMICAISPATSQFDETRETLLYANRAKNIKVTQSMVRQGSEQVGKSSAEYERIVTDLRAELASLKAALVPNRRLSIAVPSLRDHVASGSQEDILSDYGDKENEETRPMTSSGLLAVPGVQSSNEDIRAVRGGYRGSLTRADSTAEMTLMNNMIEEIVDNFQDRIQIRRSLVELDDTDRASRERLEVLKKLLEDQNESALSKAAYEAGVSEKKALKGSIVQNAAYKMEKMQHLHELAEQSAELAEKIGATSFRVERQQILHLTLERCVLELQKMELELGERSLRLALEDKEAEVTYLESVLDQNRVLYVPYSSGVTIPANQAASPLAASLTPSSSRWLASPIPKAPDLRRGLSPTNRPSVSQGRTGRRPSQTYLFDIESRDIEDSDSDGSPAEPVPRGAWGDSVSPIKLQPTTNQTVEADSSNDEVSDLKEAVANHFDAHAMPRDAAQPSAGKLHRRNVTIASGVGVQQQASKQILAPLHVSQSNPSVRARGRGGAAVKPPEPNSSETDDGHPIRRGSSLEKLVDEAKEHAKEAHKVPHKAWVAHTVTALLRASRRSRENLASRKSQEDLAASQSTSDSRVAQKATGGSVSAASAAGRNRTASSDGRGPRLRSGSVVEEAAAAAADVSSEPSHKPKVNSRTLARSELRHRRPSFSHRLNMQDNALGELEKELSQISPSVDDDNPTQAKHRQRGLTMDFEFPSSFNRTSGVDTVTDTEERASNETDVLAVMDQWRAPAVVSPMGAEENMSGGMTLRQAQRATLKGQLKKLQGLFKKDKDKGKDTPAREEVVAPLPVTAQSSTDLRLPGTFDDLTADAMEFVQASRDDVNRHESEDMQAGHREQDGHEEEHEHAFHRHDTLGMHLPLIDDEDTSNQAPFIGRMVDTAETHDEAGAKDRRRARLTELESDLAELERMRSSMESERAQSQRVGDASSAQDADADADALDYNAGGVGVAAAADWGESSMASLPGLHKSMALPTVTDSRDDIRTSSPLPPRSDSMHSAESIRQRSRHGSMVSEAMSEDDLRPSHALDGDYERYHEYKRGRTLSDFSSVQKLQSIMGSVQKIFVDRSAKSLQAGAAAANGTADNEEDEDEDDVEE